MAPSPNAQPDTSAKASRPWPIWLGRTVGLGILVAACIGAYNLGSRQPTSVEEWLYIDPKYLDFGEVWENPRFEWVLPIENRRNNNIVVAGFNSTGRVVSIAPHSFQVPAQGTADARITLDLSCGAGPEGCGKHAEQARTPRDYEQFTTWIAPYFKGHKVGTPWRITGRVRRAIELSTRRVYFGPNLIRGQPFPRELVNLAPLVPVDNILVTCRPAIAHAVISRETPERFQLSVTPCEDLPAGPFQVEVLLTAVLKDGASLPAIVLPVGGFVRERISLIPSSLVFGAAAIGTTLDDTITVTCLTAQPFEIRDILAPDGLNVALIPNGESPTYRIRQVATSEGNQESTVRFVIQANGGSVLLDLTVRYFGVRASRSSDRRSTE